MTHYSALTRKQAAFFAFCILLAIMPIFGFIMMVSKGMVAVAALSTAVCLMSPQAWMYVAPTAALLYHYLPRMLWRKR